MWQPMFTPLPTLSYRCWDIISTQHSCNDSPNHFSNGTGKKQVVRIFILITESTTWTPRPFSFKMIVFCEYSIVSQEPNKNFNILGNFALPNKGPESSEVKAL